MRKKSGVVAFAIAASLLLAHGSAAAHALQLSGFAPVHTGSLDRAGLRRLQRAAWRSLRTSATAPTISVSPAYGDPAAIAQRWSAFFQSLLHGPEISVLNAYIAPLAEVQQICGSSDVLGCYGANHLVMPDQGADGIAATSIATHEYGHHVAYNRVNAPWTGIDWGPKRWATYEHVCARAKDGTAYPGAEDADYPLNPGEAWAETYRVLNETSAGLPLTWPIVDPSFEPEAGALVAAKEDVLEPWTKPAVSVQRVRFSGARRVWTLKVEAPLDGAIEASVQPGSDDVALLAADGHSVLANGSWNTSAGKALGYTDCGQRTVVLRVTRHTSARRFVLELSVP